MPRLTLAFVIPLLAVAARSAELTADTLPLFHPEQPGAVSKLRLNHSAVVSSEEDGQMVRFNQGGYPNVSFPCPEEGWDLSRFRGIEVVLTNPNGFSVTAGFRMDNPGRPVDQFWNTQTIRLDPEETRTLRAVFGENNGKPAFPLDPSCVNAFQVFLPNPKQDTLLFVGAPRAYGTPDPAQSRERFSRPADRSQPVTPPEELGVEPPVPGNWTPVLNEEFDGPLDPAIWTRRDTPPWPHKQATHRYLEENVEIRDGRLLLKVEKNPGAQYNDDKWGTRDYASGMINTYDLWTCRYGYIEMRTRLPTARGVAAVFELIPDRGAESGLNMHERRTAHDFHGQGMEIDVFRYLTQWGPGRLSVSARWGGPAGTHEPRNWGNGYIYHGPTEDGWHTVGMLWEPGRLEWYIDGELKERWEHEDVSTVTSYLAVSLQTGRNATRDVDATALPDTWEIDYIRAWKRADLATPEDGTKTNE